MVRRQERADVPIFVGLVTEDGIKLMLDFPKQFKAHFKQFAGHEVGLTLDKLADMKTRLQEAGFHAMIAPWAKADGHRTHELKQYLLREIFGLSEQRCKLKGELMLNEPSTRNLPKAKYSELIERTLEIAAWSNHILVAPDEYRKMHPERYAPRNAAERKAAAKREKTKAA